MADYVPQVLSASAARAERKAAAALAAAEEEKRNSDMWASVRKLVKMPSFQVLPRTRGNFPTSAGTRP